jgi:hypothetical protein
MALAATRAMFAQYCNNSVNSDRGYLTRVDGMPRKVMELSEI